MTRVKIHTPLPSSVSIADLTALLVAAGLTASSAIDWTANCLDGNQSPVLLVIIPTDAASTGVLDRAAREAVSRGERVLALWPAGDLAAEFPTVLDDFGGGSVRWNAAALHAAVCGQEADWQDAQGGVLNERPLDRNKNC